MQVNQLQKPQGLESSMDNLKNNKQFQDDTSSSTIFSALASSEKKTEASAVDATEDISMMHSGQSSEGQLQGNSDAHMGLSPSEIDSKLEQMNEFAGITTDVSTRRTNRLVESKETKSNFSEPVTIQIDSSSNSCSGFMEVVDIEHTGTLTNRESDASGQEVDILYPDDTEILPEKPTVIPESGADAMVSPAHCKVDEATHAFSSSDELPEKARNDSSNLSGKYVGDGVVEIQNEQETLSTETLQMPDIQAEEADLKRTLAEESTTDHDKCDLQSESLKEIAVASTTNATDELLILAAETLPASSNVQAQKATLNKALGEESTTKDFGEDTSEIKSRSLPDGVDNLLKQQPCAVAAVPDASVDSISQTDSVEGHWGSVSDGTFPSTRDANEERAIIATETLDMGIKDKDRRANLETENGASERNCSDQSDIFDAPSFMTLVEPGNREINQQTVSSEIQIVQNTPQPNCSPLQAGWFPSLTHDVKESPGRKKNEEIIAKVSNWSAGKPHTPLKSLLVEANLGSKPKSPNALGHPQTVATPKHEPSAEDNNLPAKASPSLMAPEASTALAVKGNENKEWYSPARLPENKKEKRKARRSWVPFVCCNSFNLYP
ncbi:uncharacterized protein LOC122092461 isoform X3 [Macadamia integrifolia]|nr:uncharacterized protein LOC122092461 isoform X3 [Macadamia integrifolia]